jgi:hypothetical protein
MNRASGSIAIRLVALLAATLVRAPCGQGQSLAPPPYASVPTAINSPLVIVPDGAGGPPVYTPPSEEVLPPRFINPNERFDSASSNPDAWTFQVLPTGFMYRSYLAGVKESRMGTQLYWERKQGTLWDVTLGGRMPMLRYGTEDHFWPEGFQADLEGAAFPRLNPDDGRTVVSNDYRFGVPLTYRYGQWETKIGYYHSCSHLGDQYILEHPGVNRISVTRDVLVAGVGYRPIRDIRIYSEAGWAFSTYGESAPWDFQFGVEYSPARPNGYHGAPFVAINGHLRQEVNFGGEFVVQSGWQWRGDSGQLWRFGLHYLNGMSNQYQFLNQFEEQIGAGMWYDF